jgi:hypothetical protein
MRHSESITGTIGNSGLPGCADEAGSGSVPSPSQTTSIGKSVILKTRVPPVARSCPGATRTRLGGMGSDCVPQLIILQGSDLCSKSNALDESTGRGRSRSGPEQPLNCGWVRGSQANITAQRIPVPGRTENMTDSSEFTTQRAELSRRFEKAN